MVCNIQKQNSNPVVIVDSTRTAIGQLLGQFANVKASQLGATVISELIKRSGIKGDEISEVLMGCVLPAGMGQAPARQAVLYAGLPNSVGATTINKMCGSGMKALMLAHDLLLANSNTITIAGGMESMSCAPYLLPKARAGFRMGHGEVLDHMFLDGLEDAYDKGKLMGVFAEKCASRFQFSRQSQDEFALQSLSRAKNAIQQEWFNAEITKVTVKNPKGDQVVLTDELPLNAKPEKIPTLKPAFIENGTVTAANSSGISDGASAHLLMRQEEANRRGLKPIATILGHATYSTDPSDFTIAPIGAIQQLLDGLNWGTKDVDLFEINEAFAVVTMAAMKELNLSMEKVNVHGGACALGHPIGASGARIVTTLLYALRKYGLKRGIAALCIGGGEGTAMAFEMN